MSSNLKCLVIVILFLQFSTIFGQVDKIRFKVDSITGYLKNKDLTKKQQVESYLELSALISAFSKDSAFYYNNKAFELIKNDPKDKYFGRYYYNVALYYNTIKNDDKAIKYYNKALPLTILDNEEKWYRRCVLDLADKFIVKLKFADAEQILKKGLQKTKQKGLSADFGRYYMSLAQVYSQTFQEQKAFEYKLLAYKALKKTNDDLAFARISTLLADAYSNENNYQEAIRLLTTALERLNKKNILVEEIFFLKYNICNTYLEAKKFRKALKFASAMQFMATKYNNKSYQSMTDECLGDIFGGTAKFDKAIASYKKALLNITSTYRPEYNTVYINYRIALNYIKKNDAINAQLYLKKVKPILKYKKSIDFLIKKADLYIIQASIDSLNIDYKAESANLKLWYKLKDSIRNVQDAAMITNIKSQFQVAEKDNSIKLLALKNVIQEAEIKTERQKNVFFIMFCLISVLLLGFMIYASRIKQQANRQLENKNIQLNALLNDKELLLKEIHHRTKNNLQLLMSILKSQTRQINKDSVATFIEESQSRIVSMSLIHEALYNHDTSEIAFETYIHDLYKKINAVYNVDNQEIELKLNFSNIYLDVQTSIILGLMLNELICNSFKYAFVANKIGIINIDLNLEKDNIYNLNYRDNGKIISGEGTKTFGKQLIQSLAEQLSGNISIHHEKGIVVKMQFEDLKNNTVRYAS